jgi:Group II intron, maturase-specific domain/Reverse transcriptase (RNA-dependent DNA polymerase)
MGGTACPLKRFAFEPRAPGMGFSQEVQVLSKAGHRNRSEPQLREGDRPWGGSGERSGGSTNRNRMPGDSGRGERASDREAPMVKARWRRSGDRAAKGDALTRGDLALHLKGRRREAELEKRGHRFVRYADDCNVYVRSQRAGERVMGALRRLFARLRLRINESKSAVARPWARKFLGYSFWVAKDGSIKRRDADQALAAMKQRVRAITVRHGRSIPSIIADLRGYLVGWKNYFRLADTLSTFRKLDGVAQAPTARDSAQALAKRVHNPPRALRSRTPSARRLGSGPERRPMVGGLCADSQPRTARTPVRRPRSPEARRLTSTLRTAGCGPARPVVWQGSPGESGAPMPIPASLRERLCSAKS